MTSERQCDTCIGLGAGLTRRVPGFPYHGTAALVPGQVTGQRVLTDVLGGARPSGRVVCRITVTFPHVCKKKNLKHITLSL